MPGNRQILHEKYDYPGQYTIVGFAQEGCKKVIQGVAGSAATMTLNGTSVKAFGGKFDPTASCNSTNNTIVVQRQ